MIPTNKMMLVSSDFRRREPAKTPRQNRAARINFRVTDDEARRLEKMKPERRAARFSGFRSFSALAAQARCKIQFSCGSVFKPPAQDSGSLPGLKHLKRNLIRDEAYKKGSFFLFRALVRNRDFGKKVIVSHRQITSLSDVV